MLELKRCLTTNFGFQVDALRLSTTSLAREARPAILWIEGGRTYTYRDNHYVVFVGLTPDSEHFVIVDPMRGVARLTASQLKAIWTGPCLLVRHR